MQIPEVNIGHTLGLDMVWKQKNKGSLLKCLNDQRFQLIRFFTLPEHSLHPHQRSSSSSLEDHLLLGRFICVETGPH